MLKFKYIKNEEKDKKEEKKKVQLQNADKIIPLEL